MRVVKWMGFALVFLSIGLFAASKWNDAWLYDGVASAPGSEIWLKGSDGENSYDSEFRLMLLYVYGVEAVIATAGLILLKRFANARRA